MAKANSVEAEIEELLERYALKRLQLCSNKRPANTVEAVAELQGSFRHQILGVVEKNMLKVIRVPNNSLDQALINSREKK